MNIAFFIPNIDQRGGVERATISLVNALSLKTNVFLIVCNTDNSSFTINKNVNIINLGITNYKWQYVLLLLRLKKAIINHRITHFVSVETLSLLFTFIPFILLRNRPKLIVWEHFSFYNNNGRKLRDFFRKVAAKYADLIVTLTERDTNTWVSNLNITNKITHIYNISPFETVNTDYNLASKKIISVGRYVEVKGFDRLIKIWSIIENKYRVLDWELSIIGYGNLKNDLLKLINNLGCQSIQLVDGNIDIKQKYAEASIYCMTSYSEGLGMVLIEAQSFMLPSIAFDIYAGPSEILGCGSGLLIEDGDLDSYAKAIFDLISSPELRFKMSNIALANSHSFSSSPITEEWYNHLNEL